MEPSTEMVEILLDEEREKMRSLVSVGALVSTRSMLEHDLRRVELFATDRDHARRWTARLTAKLIALDERVKELS